MNKLSVVVIIYKVEEYINKCLDSILAQSYKDFELILVDDGSPDNCPVICDEYAKRDNRIRVIHQENQGSVSARWNGFLQASGDYISFIDGDDWLDLDMFERMISIVDQTNADIVIVGYKESSEINTIEKGCFIESGFYDKDQLQTIFDKAIYTGVFYEAGINPSLWNKLIRRSLLMSDYTPADAILKMGDDAAVSYPAVAKARSIYICNEFHPYNYRIVSGSQSRTFDVEYFNRAIRLFYGLADNLISNKTMLSALYPYSLFISKIGIYMLFTRDNGLRLSEKKKILTQYYSDYSKLVKTKLIKNDMSRELADEKLLLLFSDGRINRLIMCIYIEKAIHKIKRCK